MDQELAQTMIRDLIATQTPIHPERARQLYRDAGLPIPDHLRPLHEQFTTDELELLRRVFEVVV